MMGWMAPERHLSARMVIGETHHQREPSKNNWWAPITRFGRSEVRTSSQRPDRP